MEWNVSNVDMDEEVFSCYISIINYCYVIYNNIWSNFESQMEKNEFGAYAFFP